MPQNYVRFSPAVEQVEPGFEQSLQTVVDAMKEHMRGSLQAEGIGRVVRDHAKFRGGEHFFMPSISGLSWLATLP
jgi:hypothetical protein